MSSLRRNVMLLQRGRALRSVLARPLVSTCQLRAFDRGTGGGGDNKDHKCPDCGAPMVSISKLQIGARFFECKGNAKTYLRIKLLR